MAKNTEVKRDSESEALEIFGTVGGGGIPGFGTVTPAELQKELAGARILPQVVSLDEPGKYVKGKLVGPGQEVDYNDPAGDVRILKTWRFEVAPGIALDVLSSHQLDKSLPAFQGKRVMVTKGGVKSIKGAKGARQVNQFVIAELPE